jgi:hypothetical protein
MQTANWQDELIAQRVGEEIEQYRIGEKILLSLGAISISYILHLL